MCALVGQAADQLWWLGHEEDASGSGLLAAAASVSAVEDVEAGLTVPWRLVGAVFAGVVFVDAASD